MTQTKSKSRGRKILGALALVFIIVGLYLGLIDARVFLPIETIGWAKCPYCSAEYTLKK